MEALTAVSIGLLTIYDMGKSIDKNMRIGEICLLLKDGGKSGRWERPSFYKYVLEELLLRHPCVPIVHFESANCTLIN